MSNFVPIMVYELINILRQTNYCRNNDKGAILELFKKLLSENDYEYEEDEYPLAVSLLINRCYECGLKYPEEDKAYCKKCNMRFTVEVFRSIMPDDIKHAFMITDGHRCYTNITGEQCKYCDKIDHDKSSISKNTKKFNQWFDKWYESQYLTQYTHGER